MKKESSRNWIHASYVPFVLSCTGGEGLGVTGAMKRLAAMQAENSVSLYGSIFWFVRCRLSFTLLKSSLMCLWGCRSSLQHSGNIDVSVVNLATAKAWLGHQWGFPFMSEQTDVLAKLFDICLLSMLLPCFDVETPVFVLSYSTFTLFVPSLYFAIATALRTLFILEQYFCVHLNLLIIQWTKLWEQKWLDCYVIICSAKFLR